MYITKVIWRYVSCHFSLGFDSTYQRRGVQAMAGSVGLLLEL